MMHRRCIAHDILTGVLNLPDRERQGGESGEANLMKDARQYD